MHQFDNSTEGLRAGMRRLAAGVSVVSLQDQSNKRYAMTATSVSSLSDSPPSLLVCINKMASSFEPLNGGVGFCINVLSESMAHVSDTCAGKAAETDDSRFAVGDWRHHEHSGQPYLADAQACFFCANDQIIEYGSHIIVIGKIQSVWVSKDTVVRPLLYVDGGYHQLELSD